MGIEPFLLASVVRAFLAQRLVRTICSQCKEPASYEPEYLKELGFPPAAIKVLLSAREGVPFPIGKGGITLVIDPDLLGSGADQESVTNEISHLLKDLFKESRP